MSYNDGILTCLHLLYWYIPFLNLAISASISIHHNILQCLTSKIDSLKLVMVEWEMRKDNKYCSVDPYMQHYNSRKSV